MKIQTISLCAGEGHCLRRCPYCVSRMTGKSDFSMMPDHLSPKVLKALRFAELSGVSTALITGKGEPLFTAKSRGHVLRYLVMLQDFHIPFIEVQTSGYGLDDDMLSKFRNMGVTTVAISCVSAHLNQNREIFGLDYDDPLLIADRVHDYGMMVRLCCTMCAGYCESVESMMYLVDACRLRGIEQVSFVPVTAPDATEDDGAKQWVTSHGIGHLFQLYSDIQTRGKLLMTLMHGGRVYDIDGVSVCLRYCLTDSTDLDHLRQVIVYPNGETRYSWTSDAAQLIRGDRL